MQQVGALGLTNDPKIHTFVTCHVLPGLPGAAAAAEGDGGSRLDLSERPECVCWYTIQLSTYVCVCSVHWGA